MKTKFSVRIDEKTVSVIRFEKVGNESRRAADGHVCKTFGTEDTARTVFDSIVFDDINAGVEYQEAISMLQNAYYREVSR